MYQCNECSEHLLDFVYGLLDEADADTVRSHLDECASCRQEFAFVEDQQKLFANAARIYRFVPEFVSPAAPNYAEPPASSASEETIRAVSDANTVVEKPKQRAQKSLGVRLWPWVAAAAALMAAVAGGYGWYQRGWKEHNDAVADAKRQIEIVDAQFAHLLNELKADQSQISKQLPERGLYIHAYGPADYRPGAANIVRVDTRDLTGRPAEAKVTVKCVDPQSKKVLDEQTTESAGGEAVIALRGDLPVGDAQKLRLDIQAKCASRTESLSQPLNVAKPSYITHVSTNKQVYHVGELLFFRTLTLDRFRLLQPGKKLPLRFSLMNARGDSVKELIGRCRENGIGGGEFAVTDDIPDGEYALLVHDLLADTSDEYTLQPQSTRFVIRRQEAPGIALDRPHYYEGDVVRGNFLARRALDGNPRRNEPVTVRFRWRNSVNLKKEDRVPPLQTRTDNNGNVQFEILLSKRTPAREAEVEVQLHDGLLDEKVTQTFTVMPQWQVKFFPEGGQFVTGVPNRVYCCVVAPQTQTAKIKGEIVDAQGKRVSIVNWATARDRTYTGNFKVNPEPGRTYKLRIMADKRKGIEHALPSAQVMGTALTVTNPVAKETTPIECSLHPGNKERDLLVLASCRGVVVDQKVIRAQKSGTTLQLKAGEGVRGVVRLTVYEYEPDQKHLKPLAERLVFRQPSQSLQLSVKTKKQRNHRYLAGANVAFQLEALNETRKPVDAWVGANIIDANAAPRAAHQNGGYPDFFFVAGELNRPAELENAQIVMRDSFRNREKLDQLLAIGGHREVGEFNPDKAGDKKFANKDVEIMTPPALFSCDNYHKALKNHNDAVEERLNGLRRDAVVRRDEMQREKETKLKKMRTALAVLANFEELPHRSLAMALGALILILLFAGVVIMLIGCWRILRSRRATMQFATAFAAIAACAGIYLGTESLRIVQPDKSKTVSADAKLAQANFPHIPEKAAKTRTASPKIRRIALAGFPVNEMIAKHAENEQSRIAKELERLTHQKTLDAVTQISNSAFLHMAQNYQTNQEQIAKKAQASNSRFLRVQQIQDVQSQILTAVPIPKNTNLPRGGSKQTTSPVPPGANAGAGLPPNVPLITPGKGKSGGGKSGGPGGIGNGFADAIFARSYANFNNVRDLTSPGTLLWAPAVQLKNGRGQVNFDLPYQNATYRILLLGHTESGRLGSHEAMIEVREGK